MRCFDEVLSSATPEIVAEVFPDEVLSSATPEIVAEVFPDEVLSSATPEIVAEVFQDEVLSSATPEIVAEVFQDEVLSSATPEIVAEVFPDEVLSSATPEIVAEVFQEEEHPGESTRKTKGDITGFSDPEDSESDDESIDVTDIQPNLNFLPATVEGLRKRFHELYTEFTRQGNTNIETNLCFSWMSCYGNKV